MFVIYLHTREFPDGFLFTGFADDKEIPKFPTKRQAYDYINRHYLGWRWNGYCTVRKRGNKNGKMS